MLKLILLRKFFEHIWKYLSLKFMNIFINFFKSCFSHKYFNWFDNELIKENFRQVFK